MGNYCLVENNKITDGPRSLPKSWRNVSGLHLASDAELKEKGWLPYSETLVTVATDEVKLATAFVISADGVAGTESKRNMTDAEKASYVIDVAQNEINKLERLETPRRIAEALSDASGGTSDGRAWIKANRIKIATERDKL
tara:strand:+ start:89 stop:511 length:423 start_codon:yes stop_codon:yes gene_type:complete